MVRAKRPCGIQHTTAWAFGKFKLQDYDIQQAKRHFDNQHIEYHVEFFRSGLNAIVKMWLAGGCKESPEEMEKIIRSEYQGRAELG